MSAGGGLAAYLQQLRDTLIDTAADIVPDVDERELGVDDTAKLRCASV